MKSKFLDSLLALGIILGATYSLNWMSQAAIPPQQISGMGSLVDNQTVLIRGAYIQLENTKTLTSDPNPSLKRNYFICDISESRNLWSHRGTCRTGETDE